MDYKQKNRILGLGPKSVEWSLRTGLPAEDAPLQVQLQDKDQAKQQAKTEQKKPVKQSFMDKMQSKLEERKQRKADERFQEENRLKPYYDEDPANNDIVIPGTPGSSGPNIKDTESFFPTSEANKIGNNIRQANQPNPADPRLYAKDFNIFNTLSPTTKDPNVFNTQDPGYGPGYAYGGYSYPMMAMGGYNMYAFGGQSDDQYTYMTDEDIEQFLADGGTIEYVD